VRGLRLTGGGFPSRGGLLYPLLRLLGPFLNLLFTLLGIAGRPVALLLSLDATIFERFVGSHPLLLGDGPQLGALAQLRDTCLLQPTLLEQRLVTQQAAHYGVHVALEIVE